MEVKGRSFVRKAASSGGYVQTVGARAGPHGISLVSSGLSDLDQIIGGGIPVGGIMMVMEDLEAPHHLLLMRYFMAQGLAHGQPLLFASPLASPKSFLGTLPGLGAGDQTRNNRGNLDKSPQGEDLRIAWQYRRYLVEQQELADRRLRQQELSQSWTRASPQSAEQQLASVINVQDYNTKFDLRKTMGRTMFNAENVECLSLQGGASLGQLYEQCAKFLGSLTRTDSGAQQVGRIALQSLCAPQCMQSLSDWEMLAFLQHLKSKLRVAKAVAFISFPAALLKPSFNSRWQHLTDILLSVEAVRDEHREMEAMLMGYRDMIGFLRVQKLASINTQVPTTSEAGSYAIKVLQKKKVVIEPLQQAPIDVSGDQSGGVAGMLCAKPANATSSLDF